MFIIIQGEMTVTWNCTKVAYELSACEWNPSVIGGFPTQRASNTVSHDIVITCLSSMTLTYLLPSPSSLSFSCPCVSSCRPRFAGGTWQNEHMARRLRSTWLHMASSCLIQACTRPRPSTFGLLPDVAAIQLTDLTSDQSRWSTSSQSRKIVDIKFFKVSKI